MRADTGAHNPNRAGCPLGFLVILFLLIPAGSAIARASDAPDSESRLIGHPRRRFPLTIYTEPAPSRLLNAAIREAVAQWNQVFELSFHRDAFTWTDHKAGANVLIRFAQFARTGDKMGVTDVDADKRGVIRLPVKIDLYPPKPRGETDTHQMLFDVAAHELGHALGLPHINKVNSIMCCEPGAINFNDPATRAAYIDSRRHPDLRSIAPDLAAHYRKFWNEQASSS